MGSELDERTIPAEAGILAQTVSFTKGCYTGQELVARIDSRGGNVARRLRGVVMGDDVVPPVGAVLATPGAGGDARPKALGRPTSVARSPAPGAPVALAYVRREAVAPPALAGRGEGGRGPGRAAEPATGGRGER